MADARITRTQAKIETKGGYPAGGTVNVNRPMATNFPERPSVAAHDEKKR